MDVQEKFRGCLLLGGIGDALGAPVEFLLLDEIRETFGPDGVEDLQVNPASGRARITDDTQMTLFTASGLLWAGKETAAHGGGSLASDGVYPSYLRWLSTQTGECARPALLEKQEFERNGVPCLMDFPALRARRGPGHTCLSALESGTMGTMEHPINKSKGCGGVMRAAPAGLLLYKDPEKAFQAGAETAAITHGHPAGYLSAGALAAIVACLVSGSTLDEAAEEAVRLLRPRPGSGGTVRAIRRAMRLARGELSPGEAVPDIGEGWVGEEALALALYCARKAPDSYEALCMAVNHDGDSDSTGAICGNIVGAMRGTSGIPRLWLSVLELSPLLSDMADRLLEAARA